MSRALRILFRGAYYHVMNRGAGRTHLFIDERDYWTFLKTVKEACEFFNVQIAAYCLMDTHYHLLVHTPDGNLPRFMRHVNGVYTQRRNQKYKSDGSIFRGRYLANIIDDEEYLVKCVRYIHLNPVKAGLAGNTKHYQWSSHKNYLKNENEGRWLIVTNVLKRFGPTPKKAVPKYLKFINEGNDMITEQFYKTERPGSIFGPQEYIDKLKQKYIHSQRIYDVKEIPEAKRIQDEKTFEFIVKNVCRQFKIDKVQLFASARGKENRPRQMAISLSKELMQMTNKEIAVIFQIGTYKAVSAHLYRLKMKTHRDPKLAKQYQGLLKSCSQVET